jgi:hypothetical protein
LPANRLHIRHISVGCKTVFAGKRAPTRVGAASTDAHSDDCGARHSSTAFGPKRNAIPRSTQSASAEGVGARLPARGRYIRHISIGCKTVFAGKRAPTRVGAASTDAHSDDSGASHSSTAFGSEPNTDPRSPQSASAEGVGARLPAKGWYIRHIRVGCKTVFAGKRAPT